ncbi:hypothetical protein [Aliagarivorans taiwanensis]|uniref:hypothetical protein n=1 Tax=Aliagarivorans taiwanensis TaxID=561966 RepID=UPI000422B591|nr:hypothetical protein [Aliagarivorans taiwanensis]
MLMFLGLSKAMSDYWHDTMVGPTRQEQAYWQRQRSLQDALARQSHKEATFAQEHAAFGSILELANHAGGKWTTRKALEQSTASKQKAIHAVNALSNPLHPIFSTVEKIRQCPLGGVRTFLFTSNLLCQQFLNEGAGNQGEFQAHLELLGYVERAERLDAVEQLLWAGIQGELATAMLTVSAWMAGDSQAHSLVEQLSDYDKLRVELASLCLMGGHGLIEIDYSATPSYDEYPALVEVLLKASTSDTPHAPWSEQEQQTVLRWRQRYPLHLFAIMTFINPGNQFSPLATLNNVLLHATQSKTIEPIFDSSLLFFERRLGLPAFGDQWQAAMMQPSPEKMWEALESMTSSDSPQARALRESVNLVFGKPTASRSASVPPPHPAWFRITKDEHVRYTYQGYPLICSDTQHAVEAVAAFYEMTQLLPSPPALDTAPLANVSDLHRQLLMLDTPHENHAIKDVDWSAALACLAQCNGRFMPADWSHHTKRLSDWADQQKAQIIGRYGWSGLRVPDIRGSEVVGDVGMDRVMHCYQQKMRANRPRRGKRYPSSRPKKVAITKAATGEQWYAQTPVHYLLSSVSGLLAQAKAAFDEVGTGTQKERIILCFAIAEVERLANQYEQFETLHTHLDVLDMPTHTAGIKDLFSEMCQHQNKRNGQQDAAQCLTQFMQVLEKRISEHLSLPIEQVQLGSLLNKVLPNVPGEELAGRLFSGLPYGR